MPPTPPPRFKPIADYTPDEVYRSMRGEQIESPEYIAFRNDAFASAGLHAEVIAEDEKPLADRTPDDHLAEIQHRGR